MRSERKLQRRGDRTALSPSGKLVASKSLVAPLTHWRGEEGNHARHHQPRQPIVRKNGADPPSLPQKRGKHSRNNVLIGFRIQWVTLRWEITLLTVLTAWGCSREASVSESRSDHPLPLSEPIFATFERRITSSAMLPDSVFGRISHLDLHGQVMSVVDALGSFVSVLSYDLEVLQVVGRSGEGPGEFMRPVAARVDNRRILVMDQGRRRFLEFARSAPFDGKQTQGLSGETLVDLRASGSASLGTDFALLQDSAIVVPVHEGSTYLAAVGIAERSRVRSIGPAYPYVPADNQFMRLFDRVSNFGERDILVWDDADAALIAIGQKMRWSFPNHYRRESERRSVSPDGSSIAITLGNPMLKGWAGYDDSLCLALRRTDDPEIDLLLFTWNSRASIPPTLRNIEVDLDASPVSCGASGNQLFVADEIGISRFSLFEEKEESK